MSVNVRSSDCVGKKQTLSPQQVPNDTEESVISVIKSCRSKTWLESGNQEDWKVEDGQRGGNGPKPAANKWQRGREE